MRLVLYTPMLPHYCQHHIRIGSSLTQTRYPIYLLQTFHTAFLLHHSPLYLEDLFQPRPRIVVTHCRTRYYLSLFYSAVSAVDSLGSLWWLAVELYRIYGRFYLCEQSGLVGLYWKTIIATFFYDLATDLPLCKH